MGFEFNVGNLKIIDEYLDKLNCKNNKCAWWQILTNDPDIYIDIRNIGQINAYYNGGSLLTIKTKNKISIETNKKFIPLCDESYIKLDDKSGNYLSLTDDSYNSFAKHYEGIKLLEDKKSLDIMKSLVKAYYSDTSEKGIQSRYALNKTEEQGIFIDTEFVSNDDNKDKCARIDLIYLQLKAKDKFLETPRLYFVELKTQDDERLFNKPAKQDGKPEGKRIDEQIRDYYDFLHNSDNISELKKYYLELIKIKCKHNLFKVKNVELLAKINNISDIEIETKPILLIGDSTGSYPIEKIFEGKEYDCKENKYLNKITDKNIYSDVRKMTFCRVYRGKSTNHINLDKPNSSHICY